MGRNSVRPSVPKGSEGQVEGSEGQPEGSEGLEGQQEGSKGQPEGSEGQPGGTYGRTDGRTDGRTYRISPHSTGRRPLSGPLPKKPKLRGGWDGG